MMKCLLKQATWPLICIYLILLGFSKTYAASPSGYVYDVQKERKVRFYEVFLFLSPPPQKSNLRAAIFTDALSNEFQKKYHEKFGEFDFESIAYLPTKYNLSDEHLRPIQKNEIKNQERRAFAEFMTKRLTEFHVDNYFKTDPTMRVVYETKERLSNLEVKVSNSFSFNAKYGLAGNNLDLIIENPWVDTRITLEMDPSAFGPSDVQERRLRLGRKINTKSRIELWAAEQDGAAEIAYQRTLKNNWASTWAGSTTFKAVGETPRENRLRIGFSKYF